MLYDILDKDERFILSFSRNKDQGGIYKDLTSCVTPELTKRIDQIAQGIPEFYFGRFDIKFNNIEKLLDGKSFKVLELNSTLSADGRMYSDDANLFSQYGNQFRTCKEMLEIAAANKKRGHKMLSPLAFWKKILTSGRLLKDLKSPRKDQ